MRRFDTRIALGVLIVGVVCLVWLVLTGSLIWAALDSQERQAVVSAVGPNAVLLILMWALSLIAVGFVLQRLVAYFMTAPARLAEEAQVLLASDTNKRLNPHGSQENRRLTAVINALVEQRETLRSDMDQRVQQASQAAELEKKRLAALMAELTKSVVVCNLDGRILLYNQRARQQFRALSRAPEVAGGMELMGLGRSIYGVLDRALLAHALANIQRRLQRGADAPSAQFVTTTPAGQLLRVTMTPVRAVADEAEQATDNALNGFVLLLENITRELAADAAREHSLRQLTQDSHPPLAQALSAIETLQQPDTPPQEQVRLLQVAQQELSNLKQHIDHVQQQIESDRQQHAHWPLEEMLGADFLELAQRRLQEQLPSLTVEIASVEGELWLKLESFSLLHVLQHVAARLQAQAVTRLQLRLNTHTADVPQAQLALAWPAPDEALAATLDWLHEPMQLGADTVQTTAQAILSRHQASCCLEQETAGTCALCLQLPLATQTAPVASMGVQHESRPEYYDFDLFQSTSQSRALEDSPLAELAYTVFDTETTGLNPAAGDEIIQIGALRLVNNKLLYQETFDQLVDPQRSIPEVGIPIHGITPDQVKGQPKITAVLPAFHRFAQDTVLVAHNAAFDMRCLQVKERSTGVVFDQPVLDTLLLSAVLHPNQASHSLEAIAERFNIPVLGRHTALGDAIVTAEVFLKMLPLLQAQGITSLKQAREASEKTYFARLKY